MRLGISVVAANRTPRCSSSKPQRWVRRAIAPEASTAKRGSVKEEHLPDVAVQLHVVRRAGISVKRAEVMHLNRECRHPDLSNLFVRENITAQLRAELRAVPGQAASMMEALAGPLPKVST